MHPSNRNSARESSTCSAASSTSLSDELKAAYHEAGHATVDALRGDPPLYVSIEPDGERVAHSGPTTGWTDRDSAFGQIRSLLAGEAAECILTGKAPDWESGSQDDYQRAKYIPERLGYDEEERSKKLRDLFKDTKTLLRKNWLCVERLADLLCEHRRVPGDVVDHIVSTDGTEPVPPPLMEQYFGSK